MTGQSKTALSFYRAGTRPASTKYLLGILLGLAQEDPKRMAGG